MTVKEAIKLLQQQEPTLQVVFWDGAIYQNVKSICVEGKRNEKQLTLLPY